MKVLLEPIEEIRQIHTDKKLYKSIDGERTVEEIMPDERNHRFRDNEKMQ